VPALYLFVVHSDVHRRPPPDLMLCESLPLCLSFSTGHSGFPFALSFQDDLDDLSSSALPPGYASCNLLHTELLPELQEP
jgi:hypothetical protein